MLTLLIVYMLLLTVILLWHMLRQYLRGTHDLLSLRNFALLGFIIFQVSGSLGSLQTGGTRNTFLLASPVMTSLIYTLMVTVFVIVFLWSYDKASVSDRLAARTPTTRAIPGQPMLWMIAIVLIGLAMLLRFSIDLTLLRNLAGPAGMASAVAACGIAGWIWGPRLFNPGVLAGVLAIGVSAVAITTTGTFGRRSLVAIGGAVLWGVYYSHFRYVMPRSALTRMAVLAIVPLLLLAAFTSVRASHEHSRTAGEHFQALRHQTDLKSGLLALAAGQDTAQNSLWLIEQYPGEFQTRPLFSLFYFVVYPVPRAWWPGKPEPLGVLMPHMAAMTNVNRDALSLGPGIIGHAAAEGGWLALLFYALIGGFALRYLDAIVQHNAWSPLVVVALGASFGQVVGLPRGEAGAFAALFVIGVTAVYLVMLLIGKMLEHLAGAKVWTYLPEGDGDEDYYDAVSAESEASTSWDDEAVDWRYEQEPQA